MPQPPNEREIALGQAGPHRRAVYLIARSACDEIEALAPWHDLYAPPRDPAACARLAAVVYSWSTALRSRVDQGIASLEAAAADPGFVEYASFYLGAVAAMLRPDTVRLGAAIETARRSGATEADGGIACEIASDVKGKGTSSLMGAAASLVAEGLWDPIATEPLLFPEKNEEFRRNRELLAAVLEVSSTLHRIRASELLQRLASDWSRGATPDRWEIADLGLLVAQVVQLLRSERRRALYAGDFHQLERRLRLLSARVSDLERQHAELLDGIAPSTVRRRLTTLVLEIAGLIDTTVLQTLLAEGELARLRGLLELSAQLDGHVDIVAAARRGELGHDDTALLALLADDDLTTFINLLAANVSRRVSFQLESESEAGGDAGSPHPRSLGGTEAQPTIRRSVRALADTSEPTSRTAPGSVSPQALAALHRTIGRVRSDAFPGSRQFRMVMRLLESHNQVPEALLAGCRPYIQGLVDEVVPVLDPLVEAGAVASTVRHELVTDALALATGSAHEGEATKAMKRINRLLERLHAATRATAP